MNRIIESRKKKPQKFKNKREMLLLCWHLRTRLKNKPTTSINVFFSHDNISLFSLNHFIFFLCVIFYQFLFLSTNQQKKTLKNEL